MKKPNKKKRLRDVIRKRDRALQPIINEELKEEIPTKQYHTVEKPTPLNPYAERINREERRAYLEGTEAIRQRKKEQWKKDLERDGFVPAKYTRGAFKSMREYQAWSDPIFRREYFHDWWLHTIAPRKQFIIRRHNIERLGLIRASVLQVIMDLVDYYMSDESRELIYLRQKQWMALSYSYVTECLGLTFRQQDLAIADLRKLRFIQVRKVGPKKRRYVRLLVNGFQDIFDDPGYPYFCFRPTHSELGDEYPYIRWARGEPEPE